MFLDTHVFIKSFVNSDYCFVENHRGEKIENLGAPPKGGRVTLGGGVEVIYPSTIHLVNKKVPYYNRFYAFLGVGSDILGLDF